MIYIPALSEPKNHSPCFSVFLGILNLRATLSDEVCSSCVRGCCRFVRNDESTKPTLFSALGFLACQETPEHAFLLLPECWEPKGEERQLSSRNGTCCIPLSEEASKASGGISGKERSCVRALS